MANISQRTGEQAGGARRAAEARIAELSTRLAAAKTETVVNPGERPSGGAALRFGLSAQVYF